MMQPGVDDTQLIEGFLRDEDSAVAEIDGWIRRAAGAYRGRLSNQWDDLLQDLRLEVTHLLREKRFRGKSSLKTYLWQVVHHSCLDKLRLKDRWRWTELEEAIDSGSLPISGGPPAAASTLRDLLLRVLEQMSEDCRRLWGMIVAGLSYREMSAREGVSEGALRVRVMRCRKKATKVRERLLDHGIAAAGNESPPPNASDG